MARGTLHVRGYTDVQRALKRAEKDVRLGIRDELKDFAEPVRQTAQTMAAANIRGISSEWAAMRTGVTTKVIYVAPKHRGTKTPARKRRNFAKLLMTRAMRPALDRHAGELERDFNQMLFRVAARFNRGGGGV